MTEKLTPAELDAKYPDWRNKNATARSVTTRGAGPAEAKLAGFIRMIRLILDALDAPVRLEYRFNLKRRWRADLAILPLKIMFEIEGGVFWRGGGCHQRPKRFLSDMEKYNAAADDGWAVIRATWDQIADGSALATLQGTIERKKGENRGNDNQRNCGKGSKTKPAQTRRTRRRGRTRKKHP